MGTSQSLARLRRLFALLGAGFIALLATALPMMSASATSPGPATVGGLSPGSIQHVWLIILENKSYDETFTGLNSNSYLWQTLPSEGVLLKNYYGTGHSSQDNYIALASGQSAEEDVQQDCSVVNSPFGSNGTITTTGSVGSDSPNWNFGQVVSSLGANAPLGTSPSNTNGCTYPTEMPTLFDQFNAAGVTWKGYAQDLGGAQPIGSTSFVTDSVPGRDDAGCGGPGGPTNNPATNPTFTGGSQGFPSDTSSYTAASLVVGSGTTNNPQYSDQYVAKHFPFPWFASLTGGGAGNPMGTPLTEPSSGTNCDSSHVANLDDPNHGLISDLNNNTVPQFSWITPDNCSDAHDTTCKGNNLSGAFGLNIDGTVNLNDPIYNPSGLPADDPEATTPRNFTGGLYAADLFLAYYVPLIEQSPAYAHGLIDITFDEGEPSFTYSGNSFNNVLTNSSVVTSPPNGSALPKGQGTSSPQGSAPADAPTFGAAGTTAPGADSIFGAYGISADAAGENINGTNVTDEPFGPNSTLQTDGSGNQLDPGPGNNSFIDRPPVCTSTGPNVPADCVPGIVRGGSGTSPNARTDTVTGGGGSTIISYPTPASGNPALVGDDTGRAITSITVNGTAIASGTPAYTTAFPNGLFVGTVSDTGALFPTNSGGPTVSASFQLIDDAGNPVSVTGTVSKVTLSAEGDPNSLPAGDTADPLFDAKDATPGGGDTGSVLISPYIQPGTSTTTNYNHYSWLRTMEDLFDVSNCVGTASNVTLPAGTVCGGLDGDGHIGYAAQLGLAPFGSDVFSAPSGNGFNPNPGTGTPEAPLTIALPALGLLVLGGYVVLRRRKHVLRTR
jgi:MYXO-CTERM domain-containing protein